MDNQIPLQELVDKLVEAKAISAHVRWEESDRETLTELLEDIKRKSKY